MATSGLAKLFAATDALWKIENVLVILDTAFFALLFQPFYFFPERNTNLVAWWV